MLLRIASLVFFLFGQFTPHFSFCFLSLAQYLYPYLSHFRSLAPALSVSIPCFLSLYPSLYSSTFWIFNPLFYHCHYICASFFIGYVSDIGSMCPFKQCFFGRFTTNFKSIQPFQTFTWLVSQDKRPEKKTNATAAPYTQPPAKKPPTAEILKVRWQSHKRGKGGLIRYLRHVPFKWWPFFYSPSIFVYLIFHITLFDYVRYAAYFFILDICHSQLIRSNQISWCHSVGLTFYKSHDLI